VEAEPQLTTNSANTLFGSLFYSTNEALWRVHVPNRSDKIKSNSVSKCKGKTSSLTKLIYVVKPNAVKPN